MRGQTPQIIHTSRAPQPIGPYSQAIRSGPWLFLSGQIPINPRSGEVDLCEGDIGQQTDLALRNLVAVIEAADARIEDVVKTTIYLVSMDNFQEVNRIYGQYFENSKPARATVAVQALPKGVSIEIDAIAFIPDSAP